MSIFEVLSFDFGAFITSVPGIMIIIGIVLLIIAMIYLIFDKKSQKEKLEQTMEIPKQEMSKEEVKPEEKMEEQKPVVVLSDGNGVKEIPSAPVPETVTFTETPVLNEQPMEMKPEVKMEENVSVMDVESLNEKPVIEEKPVVEEVLTPVVEATPTPVVYGGVSPEVKVVPVEEKPREIYGGANPLENTAPIPSSSVKESYQGTMSVEKPVAEPNMTAVVEPMPAQTEVKQEPMVKPEVEEVEKLEF